MRRMIRIASIHGWLVCGLMFGQVIVSSIVGRVTDASGASVLGAPITVTNTQTGVSVKTITGSEGTYSVPGLLAGTYDVTVEKAGIADLPGKGDYASFFANRARGRRARRYGRTPDSVGAWHRRR